MCGVCGMSECSGGVCDMSECGICLCGVSDCGMYVWYVCVVCVRVLCFSSGLVL